MENGGKIRVRREGVHLILGGGRQSKVLISIGRSSTTKQEPYLTKKIEEKKNHRSCRKTRTTAKIGGNNTMDILGAQAITRIEG